MNYFYVLVKEAQKPVLILGAHHVVIEQSADMLEEPALLYKTKQYIKGNCKSYIVT